jgi:localization factor PodJL
MEFRSTVRELFLRRHLAQSPNAGQLAAALAEFDEGRTAQGHQILLPLVHRGYARAILLASMFSMEDESEQDFLERHLVQLSQAATLEDSIAMYSLGVYLDQGELLALDKRGAFDWFKGAADLGMPQAMFVYGVMHYYGTGGAEFQRANGLSMVQAAASADVDEAIEFLNFLNQEVR